MRKVIASMNMTIDGFCDHTYGIADDELHEHYSGMLRTAGVLLYGRTTYRLMEYWRDLVKKPSGNKANDEFARLMDETPKVVFSHTLKDLDWDSARLAKNTLEEEVLQLKKEAGKDIFVGSPGLIAQLTQLGLIDEYQLCVHPIIAGSGLILFKNIQDSLVLKLLKTTTFGSGAIVHYYQATGEKLPKHDQS